MKKILLCGLFPLMLLSLLTSCGEHGGKTIIEYTGDYHFSNGIAEFFDCKGRVKYYLSDSGIAEKLQKEYLKLGVRKRDDVYMKVTGYVQEEEKIEGIDPSDVFVAVELLKIDKDRGCERGHRQGE